MPAATYLFTFDSEDAAKLFVNRVFHYLKDVAMYRIDANVYVIDAGNQSEAIHRYAKSSGQFSLQLGIGTQTMH